MEGQILGNESSLQDKMDDDMWLVSLTGSRVRPLMNVVGMVADGGQPPVLFKEESARGSFLASRIQRSFSI